MDGFRFGHEYAIMCDRSSEFARQNDVQTVSKLWSNQRRATIRGGNEWAFRALRWIRSWSIVRHVQSVQAEVRHSQRETLDIPSLGLSRKTWSWQKLHRREFCRLQ
jgi:hypothetical protein